MKYSNKSVGFYTLGNFKKLLKKNFGISDIKYDLHNRGVFVGLQFWSWANLSSELGMFNNAEIVSDKNGIEKVMVWNKVV